MAQVARNLTDARDGFLRGAQHLILDRDPLYTVAFRRLLRGMGGGPTVLKQTPDDFGKRMCLGLLALT